MTKSTYLIRVILLLTSAITLTACKGVVKPTSLADIDNPSVNTNPSKVFIRPKSDEEIRRAYADYLNSVNTNDYTRSHALSRLAELELSHNNGSLADEEATPQSNDGNTDDSLYTARLNKTIELLNASLNDYPNAKNNDTLLYQLSKAYSQNGEHRLSIDRLNELVQLYPESPFYAEAQFRIAEDAFSRQNYRLAETAYTEVIVSAENEVFYEKSFFKRGWTKFKLQFYTEAIDDFFQAITTHEFDTYEKLDKSELEQFNEYIRSVGLAFSYLGGPDALRQYFSNDQEYYYTYRTYAMVGDIYLKQERYSDAVKTYQQFVQQYPESDNIPYAHLKIIETWQTSGFYNKVYDAIEEFYVRYNPSSEYWLNQNENSNVNRVIRRSLKKYVILVSGYYHNNYQKTGVARDYNNASVWYRRYLEHYSAYALNDNIYFEYAELLSQNKQLRLALEYYEKSAYQNGIIVNKEAAYATITTSDVLYSSNRTDNGYLSKHITYALKYAKAFPDDDLTKQLIVHAAESAFKSKRYKTSIELSDIFLHNPKDASIVYISNIKAESYFNLGEYGEAERIYANIVASMPLGSTEHSLYTDKLALAIYKQGESASANSDVPNAVRHFSRISEIAPQSSIAPTGLYDAIALYMKYKQWNNAITLISRFQQLYPQHKLKLDVAKKLSAAYLYSNQGIKAAKEFEKLSALGGDNAVKAAALWQAAELYESKEQITDAIRAYEDYAQQFTSPYAQYMEAMHKLTDLYLQQNSVSGVIKWRRNITRADQHALNNAKTDRTRFITSYAYLGLANDAKAKFDSIRLTLPLRVTLEQKKAAMQNAVRLYGKSSEYKIFEIITEATYDIAAIYKDFSTALLESDRPDNLNEEELNQYEILLEDQAFPFEDKAIEFFEINLARIKDGYYNEWIKLSHTQLITLFPSRYNRTAKQDGYIRVIN